MNIIAPHRRLEAMVRGIEAALRTSGTDQPAAIAQVLGRHAADPLLLEGRDCPCCNERYVRHLLHEDAQGGWAIAALVWQPGQMSPVHAHNTWCAVGVHRGTLTETFYTPAENGGLPQPRGTALRRRGDTSHGAAGPDGIHRLANLGTGTAVSIHAYGLPYGRFCSDLNRIFAG